MLEETPIHSSSSLLSFFHSWFTPTLLFLLLNLMIGAIALTSAVATATQKQPKAARQASNSLLQRLKSISFFTPDQPTLDSDDALFTHQAQIFEAHSNYIFQENHSQITNLDELAPREADYPFQAAAAHEQEPPAKPVPEESPRPPVEENGLPSLDEVYSQLIGRTKSDTEPSPGKLADRIPARLRKWASSKSLVGHFEEDDTVEARRPATAREKVKPGAADGDDDQVDARCDVFINKFKQQLKLQKLDSLVKL